MNEIEQLCRSAREGDEAAASELIGRFYERIFGFFRRLCPNDDDAADLTQKTFCKVWSAIGKFEGGSSFSTWIHSIAYHVYGDWRRIKNLSSPVSDEWWETCAANEPSPFENVSERDAAHRLFLLVRELDKDHQDAIHLHYYQELTLAETAEVLGIATSTLKYRLREAIAALQRGAKEDRTSPIASGVQKGEAAQ